MTKQTPHSVQIKRISFLILALCAFLSRTDNPLYTDTRYNDKICYNDNLNVTKPSLKR